MEKRQKKRWIARGKHTGFREGLMPKAHKEMLKFHRSYLKGTVTIIWGTGYIN